MNNTELNIATKIDTDIFYSILKFLRQNCWQLTAEYDEKHFDKGMDFDLYQFKKDNEVLLLAWTNWFEGEIQGTAKTLDEIATQFNFMLKFGEPEFLNRPDIIDEMSSSLTFYK